MRPRSQLVSLSLLVAMVGQADGQGAAAPRPSPSIASLIATIDDDADPLHADYTPSVWALCERQLPGALAALPLIDAPDVMTRMHASRAVECAVARWHGVIVGQSDDGRSGALRRHEATWRAMGGLDPEAAPAARRVARDRWRAWLVARLTVPPPPPDEPAVADIRASLAPLLPAARRCLAGGRRGSATITFARAGGVARIAVHGVRGAVRRCVERALAPARVPPFGEATSTLTIAVSP